jgi:hypothetical protein
MNPDDQKLLDSLVARIDEYALLMGARYARKHTTGAFTIHCVSLDNAKLALGEAYSAGYARAHVERNAQDKK